MLMCEREREKRERNKLILILFFKKWYIILVLKYILK